MRRVLSSIRPSEWTLLGFLALCAIQLALAPALKTEGFSLHFPTGEILAVLGTASVLRAAKALKAGTTGRLGAAALPLLTALCGGVILGLEVAPGDLRVPGPSPELSALLTRLRPLFVAAILAILGALALRHRRPRELLLEAPPALAREAREGLPILLALSLYPLAPLLIASLGEPDRDEAVAAIDRALFGGIDPVRALEAWISPPLSEWMSFAYSTYGFLFLAVMGALYLRDDRAPFRRASLALCLALTAGYLGYAAVPVKGPMFVQRFATDLEIYYTRDIKAALIDRLRIERDCFPSLHTAVGLLLSWLCWRELRALFWLSLPMVASIPFACVYLRYHYVTDVLAGAALAVAAAAITARWPFPSPARAAP